MILLESTYIVLLSYTGDHDSSIKLRRQLEKNEAASSFFSFAPVESFLVANWTISIVERKRCGDIDRPGSGSHVTTRVVT